MKTSALDIVALAERYCEATGDRLVTISHRVFGDSKKLLAIRDNDADLTVSRYNSALLWFSENWPDRVEWPDNISRPVPQEAAE